MNTTNPAPATPDTLYTSITDSPIGPLTLVASDTGLQAVLWPEDPEGRVRFASTPTEASQHPVLARTAEQLAEYFAAARTSFDIPLDLRGTDFQISAWEALAEIPYGETASYGDQAQRMGKPKAARAVGAANGKNPVSIVLPCHRVVGANGALTGFAGGLDAKRFLLNHEAGQASLLDV